MRLLTRASRRHLLRHPWQLALTVLGVAIAVAVVVGVDLANVSAERAFRLGVEGVAGRATHEITGDPAGVDETLYTRLRVEHGVRNLAPVVDGTVRSDRLPRRPLRLFGVDPFAEALFRDFTRTLRGTAQSGDLGRFLTLPGAALAAPELAADLGVSPGDDFTVEHSGRATTLTLVGLLTPADELARATSRDLLVVDVATAQEVLGTAATGEQPGRLTRIDLVAGSDAAVDALRRLLPPGVELTAKGARAGTLDQMTRAFRLNLRALSLLALLVGMFLIYNTMTFSVVERRTLIGTLRAIGVTRREVFILILGEAALLAVAGTAAGLGLGIVLARGLLHLVVQTINDLYFVLSVEGVALPLATLAKGTLLGVAGTVAAALPAAREATTAPPRAVLLRSHLEARARAAVPRLAAAGVALMLAAAGVAALPSRALVFGFAAIFLFVLGCACLVPAAIVVATRILRWPLTRLGGVLGTLAVRSVAATLSRTGVAAAALVVAVAMTVGVGVMVRSFRATLVSWLDVTLHADLYVAPGAGNSRGEERTLEPEVVEQIRTLPGVAGVTTWRRVEVPSSRGPTPLSAVDLERPAFRLFPLVNGDPDNVWQAFRAGDVLISEPYAYRHHLAPGDTLDLQTATGRRPFTIAAVFYDYASDRGVVAMGRRTYDRHWRDPAVQTMGIDATPNQDLAVLAEAVRQTAGDLQDLRISPNRDIRRAALEIFDRTFLITNVLRLLAVGVAFIGILTALMALQLERAREFAVLRATGLTPSQLRTLVTTQTALLGLITGLLAAPVGLALAVLLIEVINRRSFGWTLRLDPAPGLLIQAVFLALIAALLAGVYPAWKLSRASPAAALREE